MTSNMVPKNSAAGSQMISLQEVRISITHGAAEVRGPHRTRDQRFGCSVESGTAMTNSRAAKLSFDTPACAVGSCSMRPSLCSWKEAMARGWNRFLCQGRRGAEGYERHRCSPAHSYTGADLFCSGLPAVSESLASATSRNAQGDRRAEMLGSALG